MYLKMCISTYLVFYIKLLQPDYSLRQFICSLYPCKLLWLSLLSRQIGFRFDANFRRKRKKKYNTDFLAEIKLTGTGFQKKTLFTSGIFTGRFRNLYLKPDEFLCWIYRTKNVWKSLPFHIRYTSKSLWDQMLLQMFIVFEFDVFR